MENGRRDSTRFLSDYGRTGVQKLDARVSGDENNKPGTHEKRGGAYPFQNRKGRAPKSV
jgi:hypothetical protein